MLIGRNLSSFHVINSSLYEKITLLSCHAVKKEEVMAENEIALKQQDRPGSSIEIKLIDGRQLQVLRKEKKVEQNYSVDILSLQDKSKSIFFIAWKWLILSISFFLVMLLLLKLLPGYLGADKNLYLGIILLAGMIGSLVCFVQFWKKTSKKHIFYSRNAHVPLIVLCAGKPSKNIFFSFVNAIENRIKKFRSHMDIAEEKQLTGEMKMLRRLSDNGVISKKVYEDAKTKLFSGFGNSA